MFKTTQIELNFKLNQTQFENGKTQFTGDLLALTGRAMRSKKALQYLFHSLHFLIARKIIYGGIILSGKRKTALFSQKNKAFLFLLFFL